MEAYCDDFNLVFYRHFACREWRADTGRGNLPTGKSSNRSWRGPLQPARRCVVGSSVARVRSHLLFQIRAGATVLTSTNCHPERSEGSAVCCEMQTRWPHVVTGLC